MKKICYLFILIALISVLGCQTTKLNTDSKVILGRDYFICKPGYELLYDVTVEQGNAWYAGRHWIAFQENTDDSLFTFILSTDNKVTGVGRYFKQSAPYLIQSMRNISGDTPRFFDFITLKEKMKDGEEYVGYNGFSYKVSHSNDELWIEFDARNGKWENMRGIGGMKLQKGIGIVYLEFTSTESTMFGPTNCIVKYSLIGSKNVGKIKITGKVVTEAMQPQTEAGVALGTFWLNTPSKDKPVCLVDKNGVFNFEVYGSTDTPFLLSYGIKANGKWEFIGDPKRWKASGLQEGSSINCGDLIY